MEFTKIQLTKQNTLTVVYKDDDGNDAEFDGFGGDDLAHRSLAKLKADKDDEH